ncbi:unnamed protein product [Closterium sp. Naga37s-1]|nr:unnamed protein product [Closterium sp. Naga37s-1]
MVLRSSYHSLHPSLLHTPFHSLFPLTTHTCNHCEFLPTPPFIPAPLKTTLHHTHSPARPAETPCQPREQPATSGAEAGATTAATEEARGSAGPGSSNSSRGKQPVRPFEECEDEDELSWRLPCSTLREIADDAALRQQLRDHELQRMLLLIDSSSHPEANFFIVLPHTKLKTLKLSFQAQHLTPSSTHHTKLNTSHQAQHFTPSSTPHTKTSTIGLHQHLDFRLHRVSKSPVDYFVQGKPELIHTISIT